MIRRRDLPTPGAAAAAAPPVRITPTILLDETRAP